MLKAIREAKQNTSWINRNTEYETAVSSFVRTLLNPAAKNRFLDDFVPFQRRVARIGLWNSLSQTLLKLTCPGVPDIYQGNELWDFSLVDPDNRRPVDYIRRQQMFESIRVWGNDPDALSIGRLLETPEDGRLKMYLIWRTLCLRQQQARSLSARRIPAVSGGRRESQTRCCVRQEVRNHEGARCCSAPGRRLAQRHRSPTNRTPNLGRYSRSDPIPQLF